MIFRYPHSSSPGIHGNPFSDTTTIILGIPAEITESFKVYPNPTSDYLSVKAGGEISSASSLSIYTLMGRLVYENKFTGEIELDLDGMNIQPGIYLVVIGNGQAVKVEKIVYQ